MQQQCIAISASLPSDQGLHAPPSLNESTMDGPRTALEISGKVNEVLAAPGNAGPQTLHFPKATHFNYGRQFGNSSLSHLSSCCDENGRNVAQDNFRSPSLNSSTANSLLQASKEAPPVNNDQPSKLSVQKEAHFTGSLWSGSDKEDLGSSNANLGQLSSCLNAECVGLYKSKYALYEENLHLKPSDVDGFASAKEDAAFYDLPAYTMVSGRGSNDGSDRGSTLLEENLTGKSVNCTAALDENSYGGRHLLATNENSMMDMDSSGLTAFGEGNVSDLKPMVYDYRSSFREAALYKFREKRKMRCFEKKVAFFGLLFK